MIKKLFLIATLGICLMALMATGASAFPPFPGGWGINPGSTEYESLWKAVSAGLLDDYPFTIEYRFRPLEVEVMCYNNGGQGGPKRESRRFYPQLDLGVFDQVEAPDIEGGGKVDSYGSISDIEWFDLLIECLEYDEDGNCIKGDPSGICHNENNWYVLPPPEGYVKINRLQFRIWGILESYDQEIIGHIEGVGDINNKGTEYIWENLYEWSHCAPHRYA